VKTLIYTHEFPPYYGGAGIYAYELANGIHKLGGDVRVLAPLYDDGDFDVDRDSEFKIIRKSFKRKTFLRNHIFFMQTLLREHPDIIMVVECAAQIQAARFRRFWACPYIITVHGSEIWSYFDSQKGYFNLPPKEVMLMRRFFLGARGLISVCNSTKKLILEYLPELTNKITVIHNGISPESFPVLKKERIKEHKSVLGLMNKRVILCVSRLASSKGYEVLLSAFKKVLDGFPETILLIAGDGPRRDDLESLAGELHCSREVRFIGKVPRKELYLYYNICDLFVLTSRQEAFPFVCLEANACGKAVVAGLIGGIPEMVENGVNGILVNPNDSNGVAEVIVDLLRDNDRRNTMGENGLSRVLNEFTEINMAKKTLEVVKDILGTNV
jgi:phosphatidylinositol alpha-1,6-mannosyltransferase